MWTELYKTKCYINDYDCINNIDTIVSLHRIEYDANGKIFIVFKYNICIQGLYIVYRCSLSNKFSKYKLCDGHTSVRKWSQSITKDYLSRIYQLSKPS